MTKLSKPFRQRITALPWLKKIDIHWLSFNGCVFGNDYWSYDGDPQVGNFRSQVKKFFRDAQNGHCCYCSVEIDKNARLYDLEHVINSSKREDLMFELENLASSCPQCNVAKLDTQITTKKTRRGSRLPLESSQYLLVHPHLDEWDAHFSFDKFGRIIPSSTSEKGKFTFNLCNMENRNIARLARYFKFPYRSNVELLLSDLYAQVNPKRAEQLKALKKIADTISSPDTQAVIKIVENDLSIIKLLPPKYSSPIGQHWSGKGAKPKWVQDILSKGGTLKPFENY